MSKPITRQTYKKGTRVLIVAPKHPHTGEQGVLTGESIDSTGQLLMELLNCQHGTSGSAVMTDEIIRAGLAEAQHDIGPKPEVDKGGRPSTYTPELAADYCAYIAEGMSLRTASAQDGMPGTSTVFRWLAPDNELTASFREQYTRACEARAEAMAEDILDIADDGTNDWMERERQDGSTFEVVNSEVLQRSRLRVDTRKWLMAKTLPKKYGDKLDLTSGGEKLSRGASLEEINAVLERAEAEKAAEPSQG